jgi:hypothetical protein
VLVVLAVAAVVLVGCGQDEVRFPDAGAKGGACGPWYPGDCGADAGVDGGCTEAVYAVEEGATFPCAVWESAKLNGEDIFIDIGHTYLEVKHGISTYESLVIVISAENCSSCSVLIHAIEERAEEFDAAGALMIAMARRDLLGAPEDPDFDIAKAYQVIESEGWPVETWPVINDDEDYIPTSYDDLPPWLIVVSFSDMVVQVASNMTFSPDADGVDALLEFLNGPDFQ